MTRSGRLKILLLGKMTRRPGLRVSDGQGHLHVSKVEVSVLLVFVDWESPE